MVERSTEDVALREALQAFAAEIENFLREDKGLPGPPGYESRRGALLDTGSRLHGRSRELREAMKAAKGKSVKIDRRTWERLDSLLRVFWELCEAHQVSSFPKMIDCVVALRLELHRSHPKLR